MPSIFKRGTLRHKSKHTGNRKRGAWLGRAAAAGVRDGFPMREPFSSAEEIKEYLSGDMVTCLICGNDKRSLGPHLKMHGMTARSYKEMYHIPFTYSLDAASVTQLRIAAGNQLVATGIGIHAMSDAERHQAAQKGWQKSKPQSPGKSMIAAERTRKYVEKDFYRIPSLMVEHDLSAEEVISRFSDVPRKMVFYAKQRKDPVYAAAVTAAWEAVSFPVQSRGGRLGARFLAEARKLRDTGLIYREIGLRLGVDTMSVYNHLNGKVSGLFPGKEGENWSERLDSNQRPLSPQESAAS